MAATSIGDLSVTLKAYAGEFVAGFKQAQAAVEAAKKPLSEFGAAAQAASSNLGAVALGLSAAGGGLAVAASNFEQTGALLQRVFKSGAKGVEEFSQKVSQDLGLSLQETRKSMAGLGAQLKNALGDPKAAEAQSKALVTLAADISAAMDLPFSETIMRIQSGLRGSTEAIESLNIFIDEGTAKQFALAQGITKSVEKMSQQEKVALRLKMIMAQTTDITGAAASEAGTFAGQLSRLQADVKNLALEFGQILMPTVKSLIVGLREAAGWFRGLSDDTKGLLVKLGLAATGFAAAAFALGSLSGVISGAMNLWKLASAAATVMGTSIGAAFGQAALAAGVFYAAYSTMSALLERVGGTTVRAQTTVFGELADAMATAVSSVKGFLSVLTNALTTIPAVTAELIRMVTLGKIDFRGDVDSLNAYVQGLIGFQIEVMKTRAELLRLSDGNLDAASSSNDFGKTIVVTGYKAKKSAADFETQQRAIKAAKKAYEDYLDVQRGAKTELNKLQAGQFGELEQIGQDLSRSLADVNKAAQASGGRVKPTALADTITAMETLAVARTKTFLEGLSADDFNKGLMAASDLLLGLGVNTKAFADSLKNEAVAKQAEDLAKSQAEFAQGVGDLQAELGRAASGFEPIGKVALDFTARMRDLEKSAKDKHASDEALATGQDALRRIAEQQIAAELTAVKGTDKFRDALAAAQKAAKTLGLSFDNITSAVGTPRFEDIQSTRIDGSAIAGSLSKDVFGTLSNVIGAEASNLDLGALKGLSEQVSGSIATMAQNGIDPSALVGVIGSVVGGVIGSVMPGIGTAIGAAIGGAAASALTSAAEAGMNAVKTAFGGLGQLLAGDKVLSGLGTTLVAAFMTTVITPFGYLLAPVIGLSAVLGYFLTQTKGFAKAQEELSKKTEKIVALFEPMAGGLLDIVAVFGGVSAALTPVIREFVAIFGGSFIDASVNLARYLGSLAILAGALASVFMQFVPVLGDGTKIVRVAAMETAMAFVRVTGALVAAWNLINDLWGGKDVKFNGDKILQDIERVFSTVADAAESPKDALREAKEAARDKAREEAKAAVRAKMLGDSQDKLAESTKGLTESMFNAASDFKISSYRFNAADAAAGTQRASDGLARGSSGELTARAGNQVSIANMTVVAPDPRRFLEQLQAFGGRGNLAAYGTTLPNARAWWGRGE